MKETNKAVDEMRMELEEDYDASYWLFPAANYNGNGWRKSVEYIGYEYQGISWSYA